MQELKTKYPPSFIPVYLGKYQYIYKNKKGKISLIEFSNLLQDGKTMWEIYCIEGGLFEDVERFKTKKEAEKRIRELLK